jgi:hypothetical protein
MRASTSDLVPAFAVANEVGDGIAPPDLYEFVWLLRGADPAMGEVDQLAAAAEALAILRVMAGLAWREDTA